jgi:hypothetical protein
MAGSWTSKLATVVLPMESAERLCAAGARRGGVVATFARREQQSAYMIAWAAPDAPGGARPIGTFVVQWRQPAADEATLGELAWPSSCDEDSLWRAIEELAGRPLAR